MEKPAKSTAPLILLAVVLLVGEALGAFGLYVAISGPELLFVQAVVSGALLIVPILGFMALNSEMRKRRK